MSQSKSKIMSFRLSAELEALASAAAAAAGDKNASAWCQRLAVEVLSKTGESNRNENAARAVDPASASDLLKALGNLRQLNLDCFKISLKSQEQYKEFLNVVIASEEEWETITGNVCKSELETTLPKNETRTAEDSLSKPASFVKQEKAPEVQIIGEEISNEYLLFAEEMKNEVAELVRGKDELPVIQNGRAKEFGEPATENQVPVVLPIPDATGQTDAGKGF